MANDFQNRLESRRLCVIEGDGIGTEVVPEAIRVVRKVFPAVETVSAEAGWACFEKHGTSVLPETFDIVRECGAALFGAVSSPSKKVEGYRSAILSLRQELDLYANLRPVRSLPGLSPRTDIDLIIVRENTEGLYSGRETSDGEKAVAERIITRHASMRIGRMALEIALQQNRKRCTIVHKANVLPVTDGLFRDSVRKVIAESGVAVDVNEILVDNAAYQLVAHPEQFDLVVTTNLFGDILSDLASVWIGGMGIAPSLNLGDGLAIAEPVHGSAPDIAGKGIANPIAAILSAALLVRYYWNLPEEANRIENAVHQALRTSLPVENGTLQQGLATSHITDAVIAHL